MKRNNKRGFTIVELVVVIAVIAILAAVMIPTFSNVTAKANDSARDQEAKAAHTAYLVYTNAQPGDFVIEVDEHFYAVKDGQFDPDADTYTTAAAAATAMDADYAIDQTYTNANTGLEDIPDDVKIYTVTESVSEG